MKSIIDMIKAVLPIKRETEKTETEYTDLAPVDKIENGAEYLNALQCALLSQQEIVRNGMSNPFRVDLETLTGRQRETKPANIAEIYQRIWSGGMPTLISGQYSNRETFYRSYIGTYLDRDVKELSGTIDSLKFLSFITAVAALTGQLVNYKVIADDCDIDQTTRSNGQSRRLSSIFMTQGWPPISPNGAVRKHSKAAR